MKLCESHVNVMEETIQKYPDLKNYRKYYSPNYMTYEYLSEDKSRALVTIATIRKALRVYFIINSHTKKVLNIFKVIINVPYPNIRNYHTTRSNFFVIDVYESFNMYNCWYLHARHYSPLMRRKIAYAKIFLLLYLKAKLFKLIT